MRRTAVAIAIFCCGGLNVRGAVNLSDLGVPAGMSAEDYQRLGAPAFKKHDYARARNCFSAAIRVEPDDFTGYYDRALTYIGEKNWAAALQDLNSTIRLKPAFLQASWVRAQVYWRMGNHDACFRELDNLERLAMKLQNVDELVRVVNLRGWIRATCPDASARNGRLAVADAQRACSLSNWSESWIIDTLAAACAEAGDYNNAVRYEQQAIDRFQSEASGVNRQTTKADEKERQTTTDLVAKSLRNYQERLRLYQLHRPLRTQPDAAFGSWPSIPLGL